MPPDARSLPRSRDVREITVPGTAHRISYDPLPRTAVGVSRLGTSEAVAVGAYAFALQQLEHKLSMMRDAAFSSLSS